jgi:hypothetical protein
MSRQPQGRARRRLATGAAATNNHNEGTFMHPNSRRAWLARGAVAMAAGSAGLALPVQAAPTTTKFPASLVAQGTALQLNGAGTRFKAIFKVYDMALYTTRKVTSADEAMKLGTPIRLAFVALREVSGTDLGRLFLRGMADNSSRDAVSRHSVSSNRLIDIFSGRSKLMPGDSFAMEFVPGKGTSFFIAEQPQGAPVGDAEFFRMVLGIWLGSVPADFMLKDALLGLEKS